MQRADDLQTFAKWHVASGDIDPVYPVLRRLTDHLCNDEDEGVSLALLYVAYYDLPSALSTWMEGWRPGMELTDAQLRRPTGTERRAHRTLPRFAEHIHFLGMVHRHYGSWADALTTDLTDPSLLWHWLQERLASWRGNGRWAAYKTGEILVNVFNFPAVPTDAGHRVSSGPRHGLTDVWPELAPLTGNDPATIGVLDRYTEELTWFLGLPVEQVETVLCDWHSVLKGHYYVGHDIDLMLTQALRPNVHPEAMRMISAAREASFDSMWLGEASGWDGVRPKLKRLYIDTGELIWWT